MSAQQRREARRNAQREYARARYASNPQLFRERARVWYAANRDALRQRSRERYHAAMTTAEARERRRAYQREYYLRRKLAKGGEPFVDRRTIAFRRRRDNWECI